MNRSTLVAIGGAYLDINCTNFPFDEEGLGIETETVGSQYKLEPGGSAVSFARLCSSLGLPISFVGKVGDDAIGAVLTKLLKEANIQPELIIDNSAVTNVSFNMVNANDKAIMTTAGTANQTLLPDEVYERVVPLLGEGGYLFIGGCFKLKKLLPSFRQLVLQAKKTNTRIILDHNRLNSRVTEDEKEAVRQLALQADYYLSSVDEFKQLWNVASVEEGLRMLVGKQTGITVVKEGERGATTLVDDKLITVPAFKAKPIHTVGAGDSFDAGFIAARDRGIDLLASIRFGCAVAALKISESTPPTYAAAQTLVKNT